jgi:hypothetical protein
MRDGGERIAFGHDRRAPLYPFFCRLDFSKPRGTARGVKMTGMPAWGVTHEDELLWDVVAFVRKLPELTPEQYETLVKNAPKHEELMQEMEMGGEHKHNGEHE